MIALERSWLSSQALATAFGQTEYFCTNGKACNGPNEVRNKIKEWEHENVVFGLRGTLSLLRIADGPRVKRPYWGIGCR
jgi:hypothetical protein